MPPISIDRALTLAREHVQAGRLNEAQMVCRAILQASPEEAEAYRLLGMVAYCTGDSQTAAELLTHAATLDPDSPWCHANLSAVLGKLDRWLEAEAAARKAVALHPGLAEAENNLGSALHALGRFEEAAAALHRAVQAGPQLAPAHYNLGRTLRALGRLPEAADAYRQALALDPSLAEAENNLGHVLHGRRRFVESEAACRRALALRPGFAEAENNLGNALHALGRRAEAQAAFRRALDANPSFAQAYSNLGAVLQSEGRLDEAIQSCRQAVDLDPNFAEAMGNLGMCLQWDGRLDEAREMFRRALALNPNVPTVGSSAVFLETYSDDVTPAKLAAMHAEWGRRHGEPLKRSWPVHPHVRDPQRRLRVGFCSPDLGEHPVGRFLVRPLESLDREQCETICYSDRVVEDALSERIKHAVTAWRAVWELTDEEVSRQIQADRIDVLFDLAGHTSQNRLLVFARKPAPIQIAWAGYPSTTGLEAIDYLLVDRYQVPEETERYYCEKILRMPDSYVCYDPRDDAPPVAPLPALEQGHVTFGSFNNPVKIGQRVIETWSEILHRVPGSRLMLKYRGFTASRCERLRQQFQAWGIAPDRLLLHPWSSPPELLLHYHRVDIGLDTFPYSGGLTTCEALWMGVPVVTCPGPTFASRHSLSHLSNIGLTETIARDLDQYVALAAGLAEDLPRLAELRATLRPRMASSPLCDGPRFAHNLMSLLRSL